MHDHPMARAGVNQAGRSAFSAVSEVAGVPALGASGAWLLGLPIVGTAVVFTLSVLVSTVLHEAGHALAARLLRVPIRGLRLFGGPVIGRARIAGVLIEFGALPGPSGALRWDFDARTRAGHVLAVHLAGPVANLVGTLATLPFVATSWGLVATVGAAQLAVFNLQPFDGTDGARALRVLRLPGRGARWADRTAFLQAERAITSRLYAKARIQIDALAPAVSGSPAVLVLDAKLRLAIGDAAGAARLLSAAVDASRRPRDRRVLGRLWTTAELIAHAQAFARFPDAAPRTVICYADSRWSQPAATSPTCASSKADPARRSACASHSWSLPSLPPSGPACARRPPSRPDDSVNRPGPPRYWPRLGPSTPIARSWRSIAMGRHRRSSRHRRALVSAPASPLLRRLPGGVHRPVVRPESGAVQHHAGGLMTR